MEGEKKGRGERKKDDEGSEEGSVGYCNMQVGNGDDK